MKRMRLLTKTTYRKNGKIKINERWESLNIINTQFMYCKIVLKKIKSRWEIIYGIRQDYKGCCPK